MQFRCNPQYDNIQSRYMTVSQGVAVLRALRVLGTDIICSPQISHNATGLIYLLSCPIRLIGNMYKYNRSESNEHYHVRQLPLNCFLWIMMSTTNYKSIDKICASHTDKPLSKPIGITQKPS